MGQLTLYPERINLVDLYLYQREKKIALRERESFYRDLASANTILRRYEDAFPRLKSRLADLQASIQDLTKGVASDTRDKGTILDEELGVQKDQSSRFLCRKYYRALAQVLHPDRGGDVVQFQTLYEARVNGDLSYLSMTYMCLFLESDLRWRCEKGVQFWSDQAEGSSVRLRRLQSTEAYAVLRFHMQNQKESALGAMQVLLLKKILVRTQELEFLINRGKHGRQESEEIQIQEI